MTVRISVLCLAFAIGLAPIPADAANTPPVETVDADRPVCKRTMRTGTRFVGKVCRTAAQWEEIREGSRRSAKELADL